MSYLETDRTSVKDDHVQLHVNSDDYITSSGTECNPSERHTVKKKRRKKCVKSKRSMEKEDTKRGTVITPERQESRMSRDRTKRTAKKKRKRQRTHHTDSSSEDSEESSSEESTTTTYYTDSAEEDNSGGRKKRKRSNVAKTRKYESERKVSPAFDKKISKHSYKRTKKNEESDPVDYDSKDKRMVIYDENLMSINNPPERNYDKKDSSQDNNQDGTSQLQSDEEGEISEEPREGNKSLALLSYNERQFNGNGLGSISYPDQSKCVMAHEKISDKVLSLLAENIKQLTENSKQLTENSTQLTEIRNALTEMKEYNKQSSKDVMKRIDGLQKDMDSCLSKIRDIRSNTSRITSGKQHDTSRNLGKNSHTWSHPHDYQPVGTYGGYDSNINYDSNFNVAPYNYNYHK